MLGQPKGDEQRRQEGAREDTERGSESESLRVSARLQQDLALALVRRAEVRRHAASRSEARADLKKRLSHAGVSEIDIERTANKMRINIYTSRPGIIIGRKGAEVDKLRDELQKQMGREVHINIQEIQRPELDAQLVAENIATQLERRIAFRRAMKKAMESAFRFGAKGIKVLVAGRLNGAEIARSEWYQDGRLPLHTLKADIDYGLAEAHTTYGVIGVQGVGVQGRAGQGEEPRARRPRRAIGSGETHHVDAEEGQIQKAAARTAPRACQGGQLHRLRRFRPAGARAGLGHGAPDRGRPYRHDPPRQARRQDLDPHLPGQADHQEAARDPYGQGQGRSGRVGRAWSSRPASSTRWKACRRRSPRRRSAWPRTSCRSRRGSSPVTTEVAVMASKKTFSSFATRASTSSGTRSASWRSSSSSCASRRPPAAGEPDEDAPGPPRDLAQILTRPAREARISS